MLRSRNPFPTNLAPLSASPPLPRADRLENAPDIATETRFVRWPADAAQISQPVDAPDSYTVQVGARSLVDTVFIAPSNGPERQIGVGQRYPVGDWRGPWAVRSARSPLGPTALGVASDWPVTLSSDGSGFARPDDLSPPSVTGSQNAYVRPGIELEFIRDARALSAPAPLKRAPYVLRGSALGPNGIQLLVSTLAIIYTPGRQTLRAMVQAFGSVGSFALLGIDGVGSPYVIEDLLTQLAPAAAIAADLANTPANIVYQSVPVAGCWRAEISAPPEWVMLVGYMAAGASGCRFALEAHD